MTSIKYLYGKKEKLERLIKDQPDSQRCIRFCDIRHYDRLKNEEIRDKEITKRFEIDKEECEITINNQVIRDLASNPSIEVPTRLCYCLCLSNEKCSPKLYEKFKADICIAFDIEALADFIKTVFGEDKEKGISVEHQSVHYYSNTSDIRTAHERVFMKPSLFADENEYRLAIFFPYDENSSYITKEHTIQFLQKCTCTHDKLENCTCYFMSICDERISDCILNIYEKNSKTTL